MNRAFRMAAAGAAAFALAACDTGNRAASEFDTAMGNVGDRIGAVGDTVGTRVDREYTNAELIGFINAYNDAEIEMGTLAQSKAKNAEVRAFAKKLVSEHRALKAEFAKSSFAASAVMPDDDEDLLEDHREALDDLKHDEEGEDFDREFLEHEAKMHKTVLDEVEDALEDRKNEEIRPLLEKAQAGIKAHLERVRQLEEKVD